MCVEDNYKVPKEETKTDYGEFICSTTESGNFVEYNLMESVVKLGM